MTNAGESQKTVERTSEYKFALTSELAQDKPKGDSKIKLEKGRISPQLSCTIEPEDKEKLTELALYASNQQRKVLNTSTIIRALIRLGEKHKDKLEFS